MALEKYIINIFMRYNILFKDLSFPPPYSPSVKIRAVFYVGLCIVDLKAYHVIFFGFD